MAAFHLPRSDHPAIRAALAAGLLLLAFGCAKKVTAPEPPPVCDVSPDTLDFGIQAIGRPGDTLAFTVRNAGGGTLTAAIGGVCGPFLVACGCGHISLGANESRTVTIRFAPARVGEASCTFSFGDSSMACAGVTCVGTGVLAPACRLSATALSFGDVRVDSCSAVQSFTLANAGGSVLEGTVPDSAGPFRVTAGAGPFALAAGGSRAVSVRFCPGAAGDVARDLAFGDGAGCVVRCTGRGTEPVPICMLTETVLEFGTLTVGSCGERTFRIVNLGAGTLSGSVPSSCGPFQVIAGSGPFSLAPGASDTVTVRFCATSATRSECQLVLGLPCQPVRCVGSGQCRARLAVSSTPSGAEVSLDNVDMNKVTPCTLTVTTAGSHLVGVSKHGYTYFAGPSQVTVPCSGTVSAVYVGHHRTNVQVSSVTWIDETAPDASHCADTTFVVGRGAADGTTRTALVQSPIGYDARMDVAQARLVLTARLPKTSQSLVARKADATWNPCAATASSPGTTWGEEPSSLGSWWEGYVFLDLMPVSPWLDGSVAVTGWVVGPSGSTAPALQEFYSPASTHSRPYVEVDWTDR